jgi:hypothetical protein
LAAISNTEAKREFHAQMAAWHGPVKKFAASDAVLTAPFTNAPVPMLGGAASGADAPAVSDVGTSPAAATVAAATVTAAPAVSHDPAAVAGPDAASADDAEALSRKVQSLEKELLDVKGQIDSDQDKILVLREQAERAAEPAPVAAATRPESNAQLLPVVPVVAGLGLLAALAGLYSRIRRRARKVTEQQPEIPGYRDVVIPVRTNEAAVKETPGMTVEHTAYEETEAAEADAAPQSAVNHTPVDSQADTQALPSANEASASQALTADTERMPMPGPVDATQPMLPIVPPAAAAKRLHRGVTISRDPEETTVNMRMDGTPIEPTRVEPAMLDYNLLDLDMTAAQHVQMPSELHEHVVVKERRRNIADVLKLAIEREPDRHDLRMKLLEFYYSAAATNRQGFLEVVQTFARDRHLLEPEVWEKIAFMGRQIAADNPLFAQAPPADDDLADCA